MVEGEGESRIWNNFQIFGLSDGYLMEPFSEMENTVEREKFMRKGDESSLCQV